MLQIWIFPYKLYPAELVVKQGNPDPIPTIETAPASTNCVAVAE
jgi:hypothetical protein